MPRMLAGRVIDERLDEVPFAAADLDHVGVADVPVDDQVVDQLADVGGEGRRAGLRVVIGLAVQDQARDRTLG